MVRFEDFIGNLPPVSRWYFLSSTALMVLCSLDIISPFALFMSWNLVIKEWQFWRLITCFLYIGSVQVHTIWMLYVMILYCSNLEEASFRGRSADFLWMLILCATMLLAFSCVVGTGFFFSGAIINVMTYVWSRRNPNTRASIWFFTVRAPYVPWVHFSLALLFGWGLSDHLIGILVGHMYFFFEDIYPLMPTSKGIRIMATPYLLKKIMKQDD